jgi:hypothetical protein
MLQQQIRYLFRRVIENRWDCLVHRLVAEEEKVYVHSTR